MDSSSRNKMDSSSRRMDSSAKHHNRRGSFLGGKFKMSIRNLVGSSNGNKSGNNHHTNNNNNNTIPTAEAQSGSNNYNDTTPTTAATAAAAADTDAPSSVQAKRKMRMLRTNSKKVVGGVGMDLDDIMEPSAQAQDRQFHKQLSFKNISATKAAAPKQPLSSSLKTSTSSVNSGTEMRQRLQAIEEMIAQGRAEMETLKAVESVKLQRVARGFLQRIRTKNLLLEKATKGSNNKPPLPNKKASTGTTASTKKKRKRLKQSTSKSESKDGKSSSAKYKDKEKSTSSHSSGIKKEAAAILMQALVRGYLLRLQTKTVAVPVTASKKKGQSKKSSKEKEYNNNDNNAKNDNQIDRGRDHYTWDNSGDASGKDHYAWEEQHQPQHASARRRHSNKHPSSTNNTTSNKKTPKKGNSGKAASSSKSKAKRGNSLKNSSSGKEGGTGRTRTDTIDNSMVDQSMVDQSIYVQDLQQKAANKKSSSSGSMSLNPSSLEHSKPINPDSSDAMVATNAMSTSSGGLAVSREHPDEIKLDGSNDNVFEDSPSDDDRETVTSLSHQSFRSVRSFQSHQSFRSNRGSVTSSFMSRLTDDDDDDFVLREADELESLSSKEEAYLLDNDFDQSESHEASEDWLALSIMATAPKNEHHSGELGHRSGKHHHKKKDKKMKDDSSKRRNKHRSKHHQDEDDLSVSVMATAPRRSKGEANDDDSLSDDSRSSYNYAPRYDKRKKKSTQTGRKHVDVDDGLSVSVMAVAAEVSDWEGSESDFEVDADDDDEEISDYDDDEDDYVGDDDSGDYLSDSVMAVAAGDDTDFEEEDDEDHNPREDDMSITSCETDLPKETYRRDRELNTRRRHRRRRNRDSYEEDSDVMEAEDVSVLSTASNKRHKKSHQHSQHKSKRKARKAAKESNDAALNLLPQFSDASIESGEEDLFKGRKRRSRRKSRISQIRLNDDEALHARLAEVNRLIAESQQEMEDLKELEAIKIQAFVRMYQSRVTLDLSGTSVTHMRTALSRAGTKPMNIAAVKIQALVRGLQVRAKPEDAQPTVKKRTRTVRKKRIQQVEAGDEADDEGEDEDGEAMIQERLKEVDREMKRCQEALEAQSAAKIQSRARGVMQRSQDILNPKNIAVITIQRFVRPVLRIVQLRKKLVTIAENKANELQSLSEISKAEIAEYSPEKFDNMDTRVKMVNFLKKQIEKENEATEKLVLKMKALKEDNIRLRTTNNTDVCTVSRLQIENEALDDKRKALAKVNQNWLDAIEDHKGRIERVIAKTKLYKYQTRVAEKYVFEVVDLAEEKCTNKKLLREIKFLANHTEVMGGSGRANEDVELPM